MWSGSPYVKSLWLPGQGSLMIFAFELKHCVYLLIYLLCGSVCMPACVPGHMCGGQRTNYDLSYPPITLVPGLEHRLLGLAALGLKAEPPYQPLTGLTLLTAPRLDKFQFLHSAPSYILRASSVLKLSYSCSVSQHLTPG